MEYNPDIPCVRCGKLFARMHTEQANHVRLCWGCEIQLDGDPVRTDGDISIADLIQPVTEV